jgi:hypothetical protein
MSATERSARRREQQQARIARLEAALQGLLEAAEHGRVSRTAVAAACREALRLPLPEKS